MSDDRSLDLLHRLRELDSALASKNGVRVVEFAAEWNVTEKTVRRDLSLLAELTGTEIDGAYERPFVRRYVNPKKRLFR